MILVNKYKEKFDFRFRLLLTISYIKYLYFPVVCTSGVCMLSCGDKADLEDILCGSEASGKKETGKYKKITKKKGRKRMTEDYIIHR